jgi:hypothetical protein
MTALEGPFQQDLLSGVGIGFFRLEQLPSQILPVSLFTFPPRVYPAFPVMLARMACQIRRGQIFHGRKSVYNALDPLSRKRENLWLAK